MHDTIRKATVSGRFYPSHSKDIRSLIRELENKVASESDILKGKQLLGAVVPHAGYVYSARHAIPFFRLLARRNPLPDTIIVICSNHYGTGPAVALDANAWWETPMGKVRVDWDFCDVLDVPVSIQAHEKEHSAEVMLPLMQYYLDYPFSFVPISVKDQSPAMARELAEKIHKASKTQQKEIVVIASSDFSHFVSPALGRKMDDLVLERILNLDTRGVFDVVIDNGVSVCGYGPVMTLLELGVMALKNPQVEVVSRGHSGEISPSAQVVHYITMIMTGQK